MDKGCQSYREDCIRSHGQTRAHLVAETLHMEAKAAELNGGIEAALQEQVTLEKTALLAAMRTMYCPTQQAVCSYVLFHAIGCDFFMYSAVH